MPYPMTIAASVIAASAFLLALPAHAEYTGPSSVPQATVQQLTKSGRDDEYAVLRGRVVSHDGGENYTFEDATGRMAVEISPKRMPVGRSFDANQALELTGKLDRDFSKTEFEVKQIRFVD
ncbi:NirD/YgiW/YdeI family stress tolerance protein [Paracidovorax wautersii]|uniref:Uncharacterized protein (TIGR00156 family) n=1 Tax=Paracidovorax wautersii TaxID=1177982 RepID=A0ABU1I8Z8_9BURK|nr:NirD/YgiW/YdeI family stress tolerance protein [Paracidovorax wautersii]MDR6213709.1 uncharacterized protein (TIGR00156 family) [Paracidovorax wautersii]